MERVGICVDKKTRERIKRYGRHGSSYDSIINELIDHVENCQWWWVDR